MLQFSKISQALEQACRSASFASRVESKAIPADFYPLLDRSLGWAATRLCIELSALLSLSPENIAAEILTLLPKELARVLVFNDGYLNLCAWPQSGAWIFWSTQQSLRKGKLIDVVLPDPYQGFETLPFLRVLSACLVQLSSLRAHGHKARLLAAASGEWVSVEQSVDLPLVRALFERAFHDQVLSRGQILEALRAQCDRAAADRSVLWFYPLHFSSAALAELTARQNAQEHRLRFVFLEASWLFGFDYSFSPETLRSFSASQLLSQVLTLAGALAAQDLDLRACSAQSRLNPVWFVRNSMVRLARLLSSTPDTFIGDPALRAKPQQLVEQLLLGTFWSAAGEYGLVRDYLSALEGLLIKANRDLNLEGVDSKLRVGGPSEAALTGLTLYDQLSQILARDQLMSQVCMEVPA